MMGSAHEKRANALVVLVDIDASIERDAIARVVASAALVDLTSWCTLGDHAGTGFCWLDVTTLGDLWLVGCTHVSLSIGRRIGDRRVARVCVSAGARVGGRVGRAAVSAGVAHLSVARLRKKEIEARVGRVDTTSASVSGKAPDRSTQQTSRRAGIDGRLILEHGAALFGNVMTSPAVVSNPSHDLDVHEVASLLAHPGSAARNQPAAKSPPKSFVPKNRYIRIGAAEAAT